MRYQTVDQWLEWQQTLHPKAIDMSLDRIATVAHRLQLDTPTLKARGCTLISIAGTNGKGSCVRSLEQFLLGQGLSAGAFTSPHVLRYNERIRINGSDVADDDLLKAFAAIDQARAEISLTYFEFSTLAAAWLFAEYQVRYWLLEVGLGGRLDSVNIWDADIAIITSIGIDHIQWLGDTREKIGAEKAGIFRPGQLAICADRKPPASIADAARNRQTRLRQVGIDFNWREEGGLLHWWQENSASERQMRTMPRPNLPLASVAAALTALSELQQLPSNEQCQELAHKLALAGRFQAASYRNLPLILDVAHNEDSARLLADLLTERTKTAANGLKLAAVFAVMADKSLPEIIEPLLPLVNQWFLPQLPGNDRAADNKDVERALQRAGGDTLCCEEMAAALTAAEAAQPDLVVVFGSFYTVEACLLAPEVTVSRETGDTEPQFGLSK
ncbi:bifunctional folylpolyglutamate synthase/dihydrofolate synthase [Halioxenophilus sp. WMMB6]|uniref:bifunctional folylpolyglutamate synthase/dihydrofolate synthase n=1 Tax=Halioxenophilus sp. WMMB6 TaxID=3073815 RepID=UPI00295EDDCF|nr:Mur ligase family protein [Halioxenophilus sp. WMMB6]